MYNLDSWCQKLIATDILLLAWQNHVSQQEGLVDVIIKLANDFAIKIICALEFRNFCG